MAYFVDGLGNLLFNISIQIMKQEKLAVLIEGKCGDKYIKILEKLEESKNLYGCDIDYIFEWSWKTEGKGYESLIKFIRGPIDTIPRDKIL